MGFGQGNTSFSHDSLVWNTKYNYYSLLSKSKILIRYLEEPPRLKTIQLQGKFDAIHITARQNFIITVSNEGSICLLEAKNHKILRQINKKGCSKCLSIDSSFCENYLVLVYQLEKEEFPHIYLYETASLALVNRSVIKDKLVSRVLWRKSLEVKKKKIFIFEIMLIIIDS